MMFYNLEPCVKDRVIIPVDKIQVRDTRGETRLELRFTEIWVRMCCYFYLKLKKICNRPSFDIDVLRTNTNTLCLVACHHILVKIILKNPSKICYCGNTTSVPIYPSF